MMWLRKKPCPPRPCDDKIKKAARTLAASEFEAAKLQTKREALQSQIFAELERIAEKRA